jgi:hypothetical protein
MTTDDKKKLFRKWQKRLAQSKLNLREQTKRAKEFTRKGMVPDEN